VTVTIGSSPTSTSIDSGPSRSVYGQSVTFEAQVTNTSSESTASPTGDVQFYVDGQAYGSPVPLNDHDAAFIDDDDLPAGTHQITASFVPDDENFGASLSATPATQEVIPTPTPTPTPTPSPPVIIGEQALFQRKLNKKGKPVGSPVLVGYTFDFSSALNPAPAGNPANYQVDTVITKRVKKKVERILLPLSGFGASYKAASEAVTLTLAGKPTFPAGGQITVLSGVTSTSGAALAGNTMFIIAPKGRTITPS